MVTYAITREVNAERSLLFKFLFIYFRERLTGDLGGNGLLNVKNCKGIQNKMSAFKERIQGRH